MITLDGKGRLSIPEDVRLMLDIKPGDVLLLKQEGKSIVMSRQKDVCFFCGSPDGVMVFMGKRICEACATEMACSTRPWSRQPSLESDSKPAKGRSRKFPQPLRADLTPRGGLEE